MGDQVVRDRLHQLVKDTETPPERTEVTLTQPRATQLYYECADKIDQHNRESIIGQKELILTILSMCLVDTF
jgi:hypothetical protein